MAWTQEDLDILSAAIVKGVKAVTYADGRKVEYQTVADMLALRREMKAEVAAGAARANPPLRTTIGKVVR